MMAHEDPTQPPNTQHPTPSPSKLPSLRLTILHTNDFHGSLDAPRSDTLRGMREADDALLLDSGDCIKAGNLAIPLGEDPAWARLEHAGCAAGVLGNRETHPLRTGFEAKIRGARHPLLCANLRAKSGGESPLPATLLLERDGLRIGLVGVMVPIVTERMASAAVSTYLWDAPIPTAQVHAERLRPEVDLLIALTHIGHKQDLELARACPLFDLILGGHSHTVVDTPVKVGDTYVCQGGSHGRYVGRYVWEMGQGLVEAELRALT